MKCWFVLGMLGAVSIGPAAAFDAATQELVGRHKVNKPINAADLEQLMGASERWCYAQETDTCGWSDIYLDVSPTEAVFEVSNLWSDTVSISTTKTGVFEGNRLCETPASWTQTLRATQLPNDTPIGGRELWALKAEVDAVQDIVLDCFDYVYRGADPDRQTVTLLQRHYATGEMVPEDDTEVVLHFDATTAAALTLR